MIMYMCVWIHRKMCGKASSEGGYKVAFGFMQSRFVHLMQGGLALCRAG